jgi:hypothetical protein
MTRSRGVGTGSGTDGAVYLGGLVGILLVWDVEINPVKLPCEFKAEQQSAGLRSAYNARP